MLHRGVRREWKAEATAVTVSLDELITAEEAGGSQERFVDQLADETHVESDVLADETRAAQRSVPLRRQRVSRPEDHLQVRRLARRTK